MRRSHAVVVIALVGCGGSVDRGRASAGSATGGDRPAASDAGSPVLDGGASAIDGGREPRDDGAVGSTFDDPGCPDVQRMPGRRECDPFATPTGCAFGDRCIPFVEYADVCDVETFGTICAPAGTGAQGDDCVEDLCAANHVCIATGEGSQCAQICDVRMGRGCPAGLICGSLDVDGFYVCF